MLLEVCMQRIAVGVTRIIGAYAGTNVGNNWFDMSTFSIYLPYYALSYLKSCDEEIDKEWSYVVELTI